MLTVGVAHLVGAVENHGPGGSGAVADGKRMRGGTRRGIEAVLEVLRLRVS